MKVEKRKSTVCLDDDVRDYLLGISEQSGISIYRYVNDLVKKDMEKKREKMVVNLKKEVKKK